MGGLFDQDKLLAGGVRQLKKRRDGKGRWRQFPFHYTLLALSEMDFPAAIREMKYAAPSCERVAKRKPGNDIYAKRRQLLAMRILEQV